MDVSVNVILCTCHDLCLLKIHVQVVLYCLAGKVDVLQKFLEDELVFSYQGYVIRIAKVRYSSAARAGERMHPWRTPLPNS